MSSAKAYVARRRAGLLTALAVAAPSPLCAVIGRPSGEDVAAIALGVDRTLRYFNETPAGAVAWYHYADERCALQVCRAMRQVKTKHKPTVRCVAADATDRSAWEEDVAERLRGSARRWGMVVHSGHAHARRGGGQYSEMRAEFATLAPLMDERTMIVLMNVNRQRAQNQLRRLWKRGWKGNVMDHMNLAMLRLSPFAEKKE